MVQSVLPMKDLYFVIFTKKASPGANDPTIGENAAD